MKLNKKIKPIAKVATSAAIMVTVIANIVILLIVTELIDKLVHRLESEHMSEVVANVENHTTATLEQYTSITTTLAQSTSIKELFDSSDSNNPIHLQQQTEEVVAELERVAQSFGEKVINVGIVDLDGGFLTHTGEYLYENFNFSDRPYYEAAITKQNIITSPYVDRFTDKLVVSVASPSLNDQGEVVGVVLIDLSAYFLTSLIQATDHGETGSSFILNQYDIILAHQNFDYIGQDYSALQIVGEQMEAEKQTPTGQVFEYTKEGIQKFALIQNIGNHGWKMITYVDKAEFEQDIVQISAIFMSAIVVATYISTLILRKLLNRWLNPIQDIKFAMEQLAEGNVKYALEYQSNNEIGDLADHVRMATKNLADHIDQMQHQLDYDPLTGLFNFRKFTSTTTKLLQENPDKKYAILTFDIDNFKLINESYSFATGNNILKEIANSLRKNNVTVLPAARSSADVFILLIEVVPPENIAQIEDLTRRCFNFDTSGLLGQHCEISYSVGVYFITHTDKAVSWMVDCASYARHESKKDLGLVISVYDEEMHRSRENVNYVTSIMKEAVDDHEFFMVYQPKVDVKTSLISGAEALVRWRHDDKLIYPNDFIPVFEQNGFIETLDYYVVDAVCELISKEYTHHNIPVVSINLSGLTIMKKDVVEKIVAICKKHNVKPNQIELEVTESALVENFEFAIKQIEKFKSLGYTISMDDFGSGISSLGRLKNMPINVLKIDREFIIDYSENEKARTIIQQVISMSQALGLKTVVEGVETVDQLNFVKNAGCDLVQGYVYAKPMESNDFLHKLTEGQIVV